MIPTEFIESFQKQYPVETLVYTLPKSLNKAPALKKYIEDNLKETKELAVMVDTFKPLMVTKAAMELDDGKYWKSWIEE